ncbi:MAG: hypothetical protein U0R19_27805 [Bryobacteraceae bacterium]
MHPIQWLSPSPMWNELTALPDRSFFRRPAILRFTADSFMEDFTEMLGNRPEKVTALRAKPETWRDAPGSSGMAGKGLKLYQPTHGRFYLVSASLACRVPGLPDHTLRAAQGERVSFVLRRLVAKNANVTPAIAFDPNAFQEFAWVDPEGSPRWVKVTGSGLMDGEEKLPMFPSVYQDTGARRRIFSGLVPVGRRQQYVAGREGKSLSTNPADDAPPEDPRKVDAQRMIVQPWTLLRDYHEQSLANPDFVAAALEESSRQSSGFILLDFGDYLEANLPRVFAVVRGTALPGSLNTVERTLLDLLQSVSDASVGLSLAGAISHARDKKSALEKATLGTGLPVDYLPFRLTTPQVVQLLDDGGGAVRSPIERAIEDALPPATPAPPPFRLPSRSPANAQGNDWFLIRCVMDHPQCGKRMPSVLSEPSQPFQLASYFDSDAPARSIQVALPVDTTPAELRKFDKNVAFMISDELNRQMGRVKGLKDLMDGKIDGPGLDIGWICSLSIPIITLCAFILLFLMVILLNIVFFWMPFFKICFPLPKLKAKG